MSDPTSRLLETLQYRARWAGWIYRLVGLAFPAAVLLSWVFGDARVAVAVQLGLAPTGHGAPLLWVVAGGLAVLPALALARACFAAADCFDEFAGADWFGTRVPAALARTGRWITAAGALALVVPTALGLVLSAGAGPGERVLAFVVSSHAVLGLLIGLLIWALGHVWSMARAIAAENAEFI